MTLNFSNSVSVVNFVELLHNPKEYQKIIKESKGLEQTETLEIELQKGNYIPVIKSIWREKDKTRCLTWLQSHEPEMHAPLLYEQALAEFVNFPSTATICNVCIPLIKVASFRVNQDIKCSNDSILSSGDTSKRMEFTYLTILDKLTNEYLKESLNLILKQNENLISIAAKKRALDVCQKALNVELPSPDWIQNGISHYFGQESMRPIHQYKAIRDQYATDAINYLKE